MQPFFVENRKNLQVFVFQTVIFPTTEIDCQLERTTLAKYEMRAMIQL